MAIHRALRHADVEFLWELLRAIPVAETMEGNPRESGRDLTQLSAIVADAIDSGKGRTADALRPLYIEYLQKHEKPEKPEPEAQPEQTEPAQTEPEK